MGKTITQPIDCILIGYNEPDFANYERVLRSMGENSGAYRDLNLNFVEYEEKKYTPAGLLNYLRKRKGIDSNIHCAEPLSLAVAYLSTFLNRQGLITEYINIFQHEKDRLAELLKTNVRTVAITTTFYVSPLPIIEIITFIRKHNRSVKIIIGGPFISNQCAQFDSETLKFMLQSLNADFYVNSSQGEYALYRIIDALINNKSFADIDNIFYLKDKKIISTDSSFENNDLDKNYVDWSLFDSDKLGRTVNLRTARGCAFNCSFCGYPVRAGKYTLASVSTVEKELSYLKDNGKVKYLAFIDDTFNIPQNRFKEICKMMMRNKYGYKWFSYLRCQFLDEETVQLMKESGCAGVFLGLESGSSGILQKMNKGAQIDKYRKGIALLNKYDILNFASLIIGFPGETERTVQETIAFIEETSPTFYRAQIWYCDPVTPIMEQKETLQIEGMSFQWSHVTMNSMQASDWVDKMFLTVKNSIWLPQYNFDFWIIPTLLGKGMSQEQIMSFVKGFNALLRNKFIPEPDRILRQAINNLEIV